MLSYSIVHSDEGIEEIKEKLLNPASYLSVTGGFTKDSITDVGDWALRNATGIAA